MQEVKTDQVTIEQTRFKIGVAAKDETSGIAYYEYYINGNKQEPSENISATYVCEGLTAETEYTVKVIAYDNAGLKTESVNVPVTTAKTSSGGDSGNTGGNTVLQFIDGPRSINEEKTNNKIKLTMTAIGKEGDILNYTIKYGLYNESGEKEETLGTKTIEDMPQGNIAEAEITDLNNYTEYWFEVEVEDSEKTNTIKSSFNVKTFCLGTLCKGPSAYTTKCTKCTNGKVSEKCGLQHFNYGTGTQERCAKCQQWRVTQTTRCSNGHTSSYFSRVCGCVLAGNRIRSWFPFKFVSNNDFQGLSVLVAGMVK